MWCKVDRFYVCRRCWEWECREGHGKGRGTVGPGMWQVAFFALFFWCFVGIAGLAATVYGDALARSFGIAVNLPFLAAWVWALREGRRRASLHAEATQSVRPVEVKEQQLARDETLPWRANAGWGFAERAAGAAVVAVVAGAVASIILVAIPRMRPEDRVGFGLVAGLALGFLAIFPVWAAIEAGPRPTAIAFTERGVHFWYPTPEERRLADGYVEWREIAFIGIRRAGKSQWRALERTNGVADVVDSLSPDSWNALIAEWGRRRPPPSA